jgi:hypothetical protein
LPCRPPVGRRRHEGKGGGRVLVSPVPRRRVVPRRKLRSLHSRGSQHGGTLSAAPACLDGHGNLDATICDSMVGKQGQSACIPGSVTAASAEALLASVFASPASGGWEQEAECLKGCRSRSDGVENIYAGQVPAEQSLSAHQRCGDSHHWQGWLVH